MITLRPGAPYRSQERRTILTIVSFVAEPEPAYATTSYAEPAYEPATYSESTPYTEQAYASYSAELPAEPAAADPMPAEPSPWSSYAPSASVLPGDHGSWG